MNAAALFLGLLWLFAGRGWPETSPPARQPSGGGGTPPEPPAPPPWPQVVPPGLPPFPGNGWEYDEPPPAAVRERAQQLVSTLWQRGAGTWKIEQTAGRWIAYRAEIVASGKRGVVAFREKRSAAPVAVAPAQRAPAPRAAAQPSPRAPVARPAAATRPAASSPSSPAPAPTAYHVEVGPAVIHPAVSPASPVSLPTLRYGAGLRPQPPNADVRLLQQRLGIAADGQFGPGTLKAVKAFQSSRGLEPDGIVGPKTWGALFAASSAA